MVAQEAAQNLRVPVVPPCQLFYAPTGHGRPDAFLVVRCCGQEGGWPLPGGQPYAFGRQQQLPGSVPSCDELPFSSY